jgi:hypothetical protein
VQLATRAARASPRAARASTRARSRATTRISLTCSPALLRFAADLKAAGERYPPAMMTNVYEAREQAKA